jgi:Spy/CpxP family protein refolding chaperone
MKRWVMWLLVAVVLFSSLLSIAVGVRSWRRWGYGCGRAGRLGYIARRLDLSRGQRQQIRSMWQTEKPAVFLLVHEFASENGEMQAATTNGQVDDAKAQEIAARQGVTVAKLLMEKVHFQSKIYTTVLNPEQRTKADALLSRQQHWLDRIGR